ncbi:MAG: hypothetical protein ACRENT_08630 [Thermodesulfobacteriota bacterium]
MPMVPDNIEIGKSFQEGLTCYLEGSVFKLNSKGCFLLIAHSLMTKDEIRSFYNGNVEFNIGVHDDIIFFWKRINGLRGWSYSAYSYHLVDAKFRPSLGNIGEDKSLTVQMILVDANIGTVMGMREVELTPELSRKLIRETSRQSEKEFDKNRYYLSLARINPALNKAMGLE